MDTGLRKQLEGIMPRSDKDRFFIRTILSRTDPLSPAMLSQVEEIISRYATITPGRTITGPATITTGPTITRSKPNYDDDYNTVMNAGFDKRKVTSLRMGRIYLDFKPSFADSRVCSKIPGQQWHGKTWSLPLNKYSIKALSEIGCNLDREILDWYKSQVETTITMTFPEGLKLRPFQEEGVKMLQRLDGKALLGDEMRLGKTIQAISYLILNPQIRPAVIVVPASLKINWKREVNKWIPNESCEIVSGQKAKPITSQIVIINYDILYQHLDGLININPKIIIADEVHMIRNPQAKRTKALKFLHKNVEHIIGISGTPIVNRPIEFYTILNMIAPEMFNSRDKYLRTYCDYNRDSTGKGASNTEQLYNALSSTFMIRRLRKDVLPELPDKDRQIIAMDIDNRSEYNRARKDFLQYLRETEGNHAAIKASFAETLVRAGKLKRLAAQGKLKGAIEWIENYIKSEKLVVICIHREVVDALKEHFGDVAVRIYGGDSPQARDKAQQAFQNDPKIRLFIGNIRAAGVGLPLHAADATATIELDWVPGNHDQAEDRVVDMNKTKKVMAYYLVGIDTIEEDIAEILDKKRHVLTSILDGKEVEEQALLAMLIDKYKRG